MRDEKKYEILPGVEIPDMKKIQEAASDFSISEVGDVDIKTVSYEPVFEAAAPGVSPEELARLQQLGVKVAEDEERAKLVSQAKMAKIMNQAVQAPSSIGDLKASHIAQLDEEKRKQLEESQKEADKLKAEMMKEQYKSEVDAFATSLLSNQKVLNSARLSIIICLDK